MPGWGQFSLCLCLKFKQSLLCRFGFDQFLFALDGIDRRLHFCARTAELFNPVFV